MRFSLTFAIAVCAPLLALAAPIVVPPPKGGGNDPSFYSPGWKRDVPKNTDFDSHGWRRGKSQQDGPFPPHDWKRDDTKAADSVPGQGWKRQNAKVAKPEGYPRFDWKRE
ncbi:hypothetical protein FRC09_009306 [Ceratobasidium sp. 395]|nr:hypothetical protein FRC09_009306 [Ceratobasidium sp. 395]